VSTSVSLYKERQLLIGQVVHKLIWCMAMDFAMQWILPWMNLNRKDHFNL